MYVTTVPGQSQREVTSVSCTCVYNKSGECKHIAALIYYINHVESVTKTDHEQLWGHVSATKFGEEVYSKGQYFYEMFRLSKNVEVEPMKVETSELKWKSSLKLIKNCVNSLLDKVQIQLRPENCQACVNEIFMFLMDHPIYSSDCKISETDKQFYFNNVVMDRENIINLCWETLEQSNNCSK